MTLLEGHPAAFPRALADHPYFNTLPRFGDEEKGVRLNRTPFRFSQCATDCGTGVGATAFGCTPPPLTGCAIGCGCGCGDGCGTVFGATGRVIGCGFGFINPPVGTLVTVTVIVVIVPFGPRIVITVVREERAVSMPPGVTDTTFGLLLVKVRPLTLPVMPLVKLPCTLSAMLPPGASCGIVALPVLPLMLPDGALTLFEGVIPPHPPSGKRVLLRARR